MVEESTTFSEIIYSFIKAEKYITIKDTKNNQFLTRFKIKEKRGSGGHLSEEKYIEVTVTDGNSQYFECKLGVEEFNVHKSEMGFEGSMDSLTKLLNRAINKEMGGGIVAYIASGECELRVTYPIGEGAKLLGQFSIGKGISPQGRVRTEVQQFIFDMQEYFQRELELQRVALGAAAVRGGLGAGYVGPILDTKGVAGDKPKRKFRANLINPNTKRKNVLGAKFGGEK